MNLIIDEGNTRVKLAVFNNSKMVDLVVTNVVFSEQEIHKLLKKHNIKALIVSSVTDEILKLVNSLEISYQIQLTHKTPLPFKNKYKTPHTLGVDRLALVTAAYHKYPNKNCLVIDVGTCITYDFINFNGEYLGGAISPGLEMRFKSMHVFTKKLPNLNIPENPVDVIGKTTNTAMQSGVLNGVLFEIDGTIQEYLRRFNKVNVILTGGNANFLYKQLKNSIFVNSNFLLEGLNAALTYQNKE